jgi:hypothetical protein
MVSVKQNFGVLYTKDAQAGAIVARRERRKQMGDFTLCQPAFLKLARAGSWSTGNRGNCTWLGPFSSVEKFPHGCSCHDRIYTA